MDVALPTDQIVKQLWSAYIKTPEYGKGLTKAIPAHHKLIEDQERLGLRSIYEKFVLIFSGNTSVQEILQSRKPADWLAQWKEMHKLLFEHILTTPGQWRKINVRFGDMGDEELYRIPIYQNVPITLNTLADRISGYVSIDKPTNDDTYSILASPLNWTRSHAILITMLYIAFVYLVWT